MKYFTSITVVSHMRTYIVQNMLLFNLINLIKPQFQQQQNITDILNL